MMETTRRIFLRMTVPLAAMAGASAPLLATLHGQQAPQLSHPPDNIAGLPENAPPVLDPKTVMQDDQKSMKKDVEKLFALAQELKDQVEKTDSSAVLSLAIIRKAGEIEKLAHKIQKLTTN
jgi:hypothetical protein